MYEEICVTDLNKDPSAEVWVAKCKRKLPSGHEPHDFEHSGLDWHCPGNLKEK